MLKAEQVPKEAADALQELISRGVFTSTEEAIAAAINAWPGVFYHPARPDEEACIFLPLSQENK